VSSFHSDSEQPAELGEAVRERQRAGRGREFEKEVHQGLKEGRAASRNGIQKLVGLLYYCRSGLASSLGLLTTNRRFLLRE